jgi:hypothetical protein
MAKRHRDARAPRGRAQRLARGADTRLKAASARSTPERALVATLHGDLDWIVMKALERD